MGYIQPIESVNCFIVPQSRRNAIEANESNRCRYYQNDGIDQELNATEFADGALLWKNATAHVSCGWNSRGCVIIGDGLSLFHAGQGLASLAQQLDVAGTRIQELL